MTKDVYIVDIVRTAIANYNKSLKEFKASDLAAVLIAELKKRYSFIEDDTNQVLIGTNVQAGGGENPARQAAVAGGLNININSFTINQVCGSGMAALLSASAFIKSSMGNLIVAGGAESVSNMPYVVKRDVDKENITPEDLVDSLQKDGLFCGIHDVPMGYVADKFSKDNNILRENQDKVALESQIKAKEAIEAGVFKDEIVPVKKSDGSIFDTDEKIRATSAKKLARLKPSFSEDGCVTAGNAGGLCDGAAVSLLASHEALEKYGLKPKAKIVDIMGLGKEPYEGFLGLSEVCDTILKRNNLTKADIDLFEVCESFACAVNSFMDKNPDVPLDKINIYGGDIAFGHPLGASSMRIVTTLTHALINNDKKYGMALISMGGGHTIGVLLESLKN